jgi:hypothetical protein
MISQAEVISLRTFVSELGIGNDKVEKIVGFVENDLSKT